MTHQPYKKLIHSLRKQQRSLLTHDEPSGVDYSISGGAVMIVRDQNI